MRGWGERKRVAGAYAVGEAIEGPFEVYGLTDDGEGRDEGEGQLGDR